MNHINAIKINKHMDWINKNIAIGDRLEVLDGKSLLRNSIQSVLSLDDSILIYTALELNVSIKRDVKLVDGDNEIRNFELAVDLLAQLEKNLPSSTGMS